MKKKEAKKTKKEPLISAKGMRDIIGDDYYAYQGFFEKAAEIAIYYGFIPIETPILEDEKVFTSGVGEHTDLIEKEMYTLKTKGGGTLALRPEGTAATMRAYIEHGMQNRHQPVMLYRYGPFFRHERPQRGRLREHRQFNIEIIGTPKSVADAMTIHILATILKESGFKNICVEVNSIGDKTCRPAYIRLLTSYYRKHMNDICADCRQRMKSNPLRVLDCKNPACRPIKDGAPDTVGNLCTECRKHLKEVFEYLEALDVPYRINNHLVRGLDYYTKTVFEIINLCDEESEETEADKSRGKGAEEKEASEPKPQPLAIASGGRYDYLAKRLGSKKDISAVGGAIGVDRVIMSKEYKKFDPRVVKKPKVYFIQLGNEARLKSMAVVEILRKAKVPVTHSLSKDSLGAQLGIAEKLKIPYTIIFGQKEALDETAIVRNMSTRSQDTVKLSELAAYIKKIK